MSQISLAQSSFLIISSEVTNEDSDLGVIEDEGSDSDLEESRPSKPRPMRNGLMTGKQTA